MAKRTIQGLRADKRMTQDDLGNAVGVDKATIQRYESFRSMPLIKTAQDIAKVFGVSMDDIKWYEGDD